MDKPSTAFLGLAERRRVRRPLVTPVTGRYSSGPTRPRTHDDRCPRSSPSPYAFARLRMTASHTLVARGALGLYVLWLAFAYAVLLDASTQYAWHFLLYGLVALLMWKPGLVRPRGRARPTPMHFATVGVLWSALVAMPFATLLRGDLHPNLVVNSLLWLGGCGALVGAWTWLLRRYRWSMMRLWMVTGMLALTEPGHVLIRAASHGEWSGVFVLFPVLHAVHACLVLPIANAYRDSLATATAREPRLAGSVVAWLVAGLAFLVGNGVWLALGKRWLGA